MSDWELIFHRDPMSVPILVRSHAYTSFQAHCYSDIPTYLPGLWFSDLPLALPPSHPPSSVVSQGVPISTWMRWVGYGRTVYRWKWMTIWEGIKCVLMYFIEGDSLSHPSITGPFHPSIIPSYVESIKFLVIRFAEQRS